MSWFKPPRSRAIDWSYRMHQVTGWGRPAIPWPDRSSGWPR